MKNIYDVLRHLVEHAAWPVDEAKQKAHAVLDQMQQSDATLYGAEHLAGDGQDTAKTDPADAKKAVS
jgi:hypothetical protein